MRTRASTATLILRQAQDGERRANRFFDDKSSQAKQVIVQVKSGYVVVSHVRDLKGVIEREKATLGALITLREPTKPTLKEAAAAGFPGPKDQEPSPEGARSPGLSRPFGACPTKANARLKPRLLAHKR